MLPVRRRNENGGVHGAVSSNLFLIKHWEFFRSGCVNAIKKLSYRLSVILGPYWRIVWTLCSEKEYASIFFQSSLGPIAQLVEHLICNEGVSGSNPLGSTKFDLHQN